MYISGLSRTSSLYMVFCNRQIGLVRALFAALAFCLSASGMTVSLFRSVQSPAPVGTAVSWSANVTNAAPGTLWFRYRIRTPDSTSFRTIRDYSPNPKFDWVPIQSEGSYDIEMTARNRETGETSVI